jgi:diaminopimelate decarboxylase
MTRAFHDRIGPAEVEAIWRASCQAGFLGSSSKSVIVHDLGRLRFRLAELAAAFPAATLHAVAIKANPLVEVLRVVVQCGGGLEAASLEEVYVAIAAGCPPERIVFDSPAKTEAEICESLQLGIHVNADNFAELSRIDEAITRCETTSTIGLRINPEVAAGAIAQTSVGSAGARFGVSIHRDRDQIIAAFARFDWLLGLHIHVGSQGCGIDLLCEAAAKIQSLRSEITNITGRRIRLVDIGGGLPAAYREHDAPATPEQYAQLLRQQAPELMQPDVQLMTEFGRAVQAGCGLALSRVEYVRPTAQGNMAVIHLGADFLLRPVYRPSDWAHEFLLLDQQGAIKSGESAPLTIAGPLCFAGDILATDIDMPQVQVGDWIAIRDCGAYTLSMWSRHCSRGIPTVLGFDDEAGEVRLLRQGETPADVAQYWSRGAGP